jgi:hypothetical protein
MAAPRGAGVAVPSLILGLVPRPLAWAGLVVAAAGVLSTLTLLTSTVDFTLSVGRFAGLIWLVAASITLPQSRRALNIPVPAPSSQRTVTP